MSSIYVGCAGMILGWPIRAPNSPYIAALVVGFKKVKDEPHTCMHVAVQTGLSG